MTKLLSAMGGPSTALLHLAALRAGVDFSELPGGEALITAKGQHGGGGSHASSSLHYDPSEVLELGEAILARHQSALRSDLERFSLYEQLFIAALDVDDLKKARLFLDKITRRFPQPKGSATTSSPASPASAPASATSSDSKPISARLQRLVGMLAEAEGDFTKAIKIYEAVLQQDEAAASVRKRLVAVHVARGDRTQAIELLVNYLDHFMQDAEGWTQLAELYMAEGMFQQAAFCIEELLLLKPASHLVQLRYADLLKTMGGKDPLALKYYCAALEVASDNVRALYGIRLLCKDLLEKEKAKTSTHGGSATSAKLTKRGEPDDGTVPPTLEVLQALYDLAGKRLEAVYEDAAKTAPAGTDKKGSSTLLTVVKAWLQ
ncbi:hypothetical protein DFJ73DRAFT_835875 [Zopfochytrium polystomum]|nr:hypothetical protein DFJ73DRAFT_835875 [Zopfochytrium polystomum]